MAAIVAAAGTAAAPSPSGGEEAAEWWSAGSLELLRAFQGKLRDLLHGSSLSLPTTTKACPPPPPPSRNSSITEDTRGGSDDVAGPTGGWQEAGSDLSVALSVMMSAGASINTGVTRFALLFGSDPGVDVSRSMLDEMGGWAEHLQSSLLVSSRLGAGEPLVELLSKAVKGVLLTLQDLTGAVVGGRKDEVPMHTGKVWEACKVLTSCPKTNQMAVRRRMLEWSLTLKDSIDEFQTMVEEADDADDDEEEKEEDGGEGGCGGGSGVSAGLGALSLDPSSSKRVAGSSSSSSSKKSKEEDQEDDDDNDFDDFADLDDIGGYSKREGVAAAAVLDVFKSARGVIKVANDELAGLPADGSTHKEICMSFLGAVKDVCDHCSEMSAMLYPPLEGGAIGAALRGLSELMRAFVDVYRTYTEGKEAAAAAAGERQGEGGGDCSVNAGASGKSRSGESSSENSVKTSSAGSSSGSSEKSSGESSSDACRKDVAAAATAAAKAKANSKAAVLGERLQAKLGAAQELVSAMQ